MPRCMGVEFSEMEGSCGGGWWVCDPVLEREEMC